MSAGMVRGFLTRVLNSATVYLMQSEADAQRLRALGANSSRVSVIGNLKYDIAAAPANPLVNWLQPQLAASQQPIPMDAKLLQMRRAVELSEEQLKNKRLTVAQDVVWALINSPAFLYNH